MEIWTTVRTVLEASPAISSHQLIEKVQRKTGRSRSTIYEHLATFELQGKIYRDRGHYWLQKPSEPAPGPLKALTDWWESRAKRKQLERQNRYRARVAPALAHFRHRAEVDGIQTFKDLVEQEDRLDNAIRQESKR